MWLFFSLVWRWLVALQSFRIPLVLYESNIRRKSLCGRATPNLCDGRLICYLSNAYWTKYCDNGYDLMSCRHWLYFFSEPVCTHCNTECTEKLYKVTMITDKLCKIIISHIIDMIVYFYNSLIIFSLIMVRPRFHIRNGHLLNTHQKSQNN